MVDQQRESEQRSSGELLATIADAWERSHRVADRLAGLDRAMRQGTPGGNTTAKSSLARRHPRATRPSLEPRSEQPASRPWQW